MDARIALVDGIMLAIRQWCNSSQRPLSEDSRYTYSEYASDRDELTRRELIEELIRHKLNKADTSPFVFSGEFWSRAPDTSFTSREGG
jgi:hypothetical protein